MTDTESRKTGRTTPPNFRGKLILAPMVRIGTLPSRLLAIEYGADLVYTHEVIDHKILQCKRVKNDLLGTIDYVMPDETVVFRTCDQERESVIFQLGTSCAKRALAVAQKLHHDVAGIDINMGCPKEFSIKGGMGAALLKKPEKIRDILTTLVQKAPKSLSITCKIRTLDTLEATVELAKMIESTGVHALAVHGRLTAERPRHANRNHVIRAIAEAVSIPIIANGGSKDHIKTYNDIERFRKETGAASVMIARSAMWNFSIFRPEGLIDLEELLLVYARKAIRYDFSVHNMKYCLQIMLHEELETPRGKALLAAGSVREISQLWNLETLYDDCHSEWTRKKDVFKLKRTGENFSDHPNKRMRTDDVITQDLRIERRNFDDRLSPKLLLNNYWRQTEKEPAVYDSPFNPLSRMYHTICSFEGKLYATEASSMSKKLSEQGSAAVCLRTLGLADGLISETDSSACAGVDTKDNSTISALKADS